MRVQQEKSELEKETTYEEVCTDMKKRSEGDMKGFLYSRETSGSSDFERLISGMLKPTLLPRIHLQMLSKQ